MVGHFPPIALSFWRWALAFVVLAPFAARAIWRARAVIASHWQVIAVLSLLGVGCYNSLQYLALQSASAVNATLIGASAPVAGLAIGAMFFDTRVHARQWMGAGLSLAGVLIVIARGDPARLAALELATGDLIMLLATVLWSVYTWLLRKHRPPLPLMAFLPVQIGVGALMILPFCLLEFTLTKRVPEPTITNAVALTYVVLLPSIAAYFCWDRGVARAGAVIPMYFVNLTPVFAGLLAAVFLNEPIGLYHVVGGALILFGIHLANRA